MIDTLQLTISTYISILVIIFRFGFWSCVHVFLRLWCWLSLGKHFMIALRFVCFHIDTPWAFSLAQFFSQLAWLFFFSSPGFPNGPPFSKYKELWFLLLFFEFCFKKFHEFLQTFRCWIPVLPKIGWFVHVVWRYWIVVRTTSTCLKGSRVVLEPLLQPGGAEPQSGTRHYHMPHCQPGQ
jgi:hypothetical protein